MTAIEEHRRDSIQLSQVFNTKEEDEDEMAISKDCDTTGSPSDSDYSLLGTSSSSHGSVLRVTTLEESLAHVDIERATSSSGSSSNEEGAQDEDASESMVDASHKSVTFADVEVREYPICMGDNPSVMTGAPLSIDWEAQYEGKVSLDDYETSRPERRRYEELRIPAFVREEMLRKCGYSRLDIQKGVRDVNLARNQRKRTDETHRLHRAQEVAERLVRGALNATVRRNKKKQERDLIDHFRTEAAILQKEGRAVRRSTWHAAPVVPKKAEAERRKTWHAPNKNIKAEAIGHSSLSSGLDAAGLNV